MQITKNFNSKEFACKDGTQVPKSLHLNMVALAQNLQIIRDKIGKPIIINSGYRTPIYNKKISGSPKSQHLTASASDIRVVGMSSEALHRVILDLIKEGKIHNGGLGLYNTFVHYDIRKTPTRWDLRK